jgi:hypothetical protein
MAAPEVCFYCLGKRIEIGVCIDCRTKWDIMKREFEWNKKQLEFMKRERWRLFKEISSLQKALENKGKKP